MVRLPDPNDLKRRLRARAVNKDAPLTPRYREVVALVGFGMPYRETGELLSISRHTVRQYAKEIRTLVESDRTPRDTLVALYQARKSEFGPLAEALRGTGITAPQAG